MNVWRRIRNADRQEHGTDGGKAGASDGHASGKAVRDGGSIVWIASGIEGLGEKHFEDWMLNHEDPLDMIPHIEREFVLGGHKAAAIAMVMKRAKIYLYTELKQDFVEKLHFNYVSDLQNTVNELLQQYGDDASVLLMPYGGSTLPVPEM